MRSAMTPDRPSSFLASRNISVNLAFGSARFPDALSSPRRCFSGAVAGVLLARGWSLEHSMARKGAGQRASSV
jgi:hypothetical protein